MKHIFLFVALFLIVANSIMAQGNDIEYKLKKNFGGSIVVKHNGKKMTKADIDEMLHKYNSYDRYYKLKSNRVGLTFVEYLAAIGVGASIGKIIYDIDKQRSRLPYFTLVGSLGAWLGVGIAKTNNKLDLRSIVNQWNPDTKASETKLYLTPLGAKLQVTF